MAQYCQKGDIVGLEGRMETRTYQGSDGQKKYVTEVHVNRIEFIFTKGKQGQPQVQNYGGQPQGYAPQGQPQVQNYGGQPQGYAQAAGAENEMDWDAITPVDDGEIPF